MRARGGVSAGGCGALLAALSLVGTGRADVPVTLEMPPSFADELFRRGGEAYDAGDYELAHTLYGQAFSKKATHDIAAMLAQSDIKRGKLCEADEHLTYAVSHFPPSFPDARKDRILRAQA